MQNDKNFVSFTTIFVDSYYTKREIWNIKHWSTTSMCVGFERPYPAYDIHTSIFVNFYDCPLVSSWQCKNCDTRKQCFLVNNCTRAWSILSSEADSVPEGDSMWKICRWDGYKPYHMQLRHKMKKSPQSTFWLVYFLLYIIIYESNHSYKMQENAI